jgi:3-oxoacyl-[acyl-carrier protein] reductase
MQDKLTMPLKSRCYRVTKSVALELGSRNIRCNAIAPGFIETEMTSKLNDDVVQG